MRRRYTSNEHHVHCCVRELRNKSNLSLLLENSVYLFNPWDTKAASVLDFMKHPTALDMWNIQLYLSSGCHHFLTKAGFVRTRTNMGHERSPSNTDIWFLWLWMSLGLSSAHDWRRYHNSHLVRQLWEEQGWKKASSQKNSELQCPVVCTSLTSQTGATNKKWKALQSKLVYEKLLPWRTSCNLLMFRREISHNEACVYLQEIKGKKHWRKLVKGATKPLATVFCCSLFVKRSVFYSCLQRIRFNFS